RGGGVQFLRQPHQGVRHGDGQLLVGLPEHRQAALLQVGEKPSEHAMAMSGGKGAPGRTTMAEINVTPMVDVMLVLLIIFMVTAPLIPQGVEVNLAEAKAAPVEATEKKLVLSVDAAYRVFLGEVEIPKEE